MKQLKFNQETVWNFMSTTRKEFLVNSNKIRKLRKISCQGNGKLVSNTFHVYKVGKQKIFELKLISGPQVRINVPTGEYYRIYWLVLQHLLVIEQ